jgi:uncharacterized membrane protein HdeD (DUF308 family)
LLRGLFAVLFGVLTFVWPGVTLVTLILFYGVYALMDGVLAVVAAIQGRAPAPRWWLAIVGLAGIAAGVLTLLWPGLTALLLLFLIAGWAIASGITQIVGAIEVRKQIEGEWLLIVGGILSVLFGLFLLARPGAGALAVIFVIGTYAIAYGVLLIWFALRLRRHATAAI